MTANDLIALAEVVKPAEGLRLKAYQDSVGVWTIGYGENLQELTIDQQQADQWLVRSLLRAEREASRYAWYAGLSIRRQTAIVEMLFNLGWVRFNGFHQMIAALSRGDFNTAADEALASKWRGQVGEARASRIADAIRKG